MSIVITEKIPEGATRGLVVSFANSDGDAITPESVDWTLTNNSGDIVNNRDAVSETPGTSVTIVLSGDDLIMADKYDTKRFVLVETVDDYTDLGDDKPDNEEWELTLRPLKGVPYS